MVINPQACASVTEKEGKVFPSNGRWFLLATLTSILVLGLTACTGATTAQPTMQIVKPADGATVTGPKVTVEVAVTNWKLVPAGSPVAEGEGHLHFFVDLPASAVAVGQVIPPTTANPQIVHAGGAPLTSRELTLTPGTPTITVVMGNSGHVALSSPTPQTITLHVQ